jgi:hypothetical protein
MSHSPLLGDPLVYISSWVQRTSPYFTIYKRKPNSKEQAEAKAPKLRRGFK